MACATAAWAGTCPATPVASVSSPAIPADVCIPDPLRRLTIDFFDDYSWRAFVAMVWPAAKGQRGVPDEHQKVGGTPGRGSSRRINRCGRSFTHDGSAPTADFNEYEGAAQNACQATGGFGGVVLAS